MVRGLTTGWNNRLRATAWRIAAFVLFGGAIWLIVELGPAGDDVSGRARAADGDTLVISGERIRLLGLDAPELAQVCWHKDATEWACGEAARRRMASLIAKGDVTCRGNERDKYGRLLASCSVAGKDLGAVLVREGLAVGDWEYKADELAARSARTGIWGGRFDTPRQWRDTHGVISDNQGWLDWLLGWF